MRRSPPIQLVVHGPNTEAGRQALSCRVSAVQADSVTDVLCCLNCPTAQKLALLDAVIASAKQEKKDRADQQKMAEPPR